jgi:hypothetical protein
VPRELDAVVQKALVRDREKRFQSAPEFLEAMEAACPPSPARDLAAIVKAYCGERLDTRRTTLQGMLDGSIEPLSESRLPVGAGSADAPTSASAPSPRRRLAAAQADEGTEAKIAATRSAPPPRRPSTMALWVGAVVVVIASAIGGGAALWSRRKASPAPAAVVRLVPVASSPAPSGDVAADEVSLQLTADAPIERVSAPGIHDAQVDGSHARLVVARWGGELPIDAVLAGGHAAHAVATSDGPRELRLVAAPDAPPAPSATASASVQPAPSASAPRTKPTPRPVRPGTGAPPQSELHQNPY